jgi:hypothetical protein
MAGVVILSSLEDEGLFSVFIFLKIRNDLKFPRFTQVSS